MRNKVLNRFCAFLLIGILASSSVVMGYSKARTVKAFDFVITPMIAYEVIATLLAACGVTIGGIALVENKDAIADAILDYAQSEYNTVRDKLYVQGVAMKEFGDFIGESYEKGRVAVDGAVSYFIEGLAEHFSYDIFSGIDFGIDTSVVDLPAYDITDVGISESLQGKITVQSGLNFFGSNTIRDSMKKYSDEYDAAFTDYIEFSDGRVYVGVGMVSKSYASNNSVHVSPRWMNASAWTVVTGAGPDNSLVANYKLISPNYFQIWNDFMANPFKVSSSYNECRSDAISYRVYVNPAYSFALDTGIGVPLDDSTGFVDFDPLGMIQKKLEELDTKLSDLNFGSVNDAGELTNDIPIVDPQVWADVADDVITWDDAIADNKIVVWDPVTDMPVVGELPDVVDPDKPVDPDPDKPDNPDVPSPGFDKTGLTADLSKLFPFCIPFDLIRAIQVFNHEPETPRVEWTLNIEPLDYSYTFVIDLESFNTVAAVCRTMFLIMFLVGLIMATRSLIKG